MITSFLQYIIQEAQITPEQLRTKFYVGIPKDDFDNILKADPTAIVGDYSIG